MGENVELNFDIYSMLFVSTFHAEYVYDLYRKKTEKEEIKKKILDPSYKIKEEEEPERFLKIRRERKRKRDMKRTNKNDNYIAQDPIES